ncbi:MAG TPA: ATP-dependent DNA helicase RecG [Rhodospirillaceae bacterium]|nr:MAG: ATP-dependent DNA helicase RecG [Alphaproteobacteria bacterium GWF2_58_20]HAU28765.1 ATP-dependent DNA helicase RecG [Rhodospirillaceae bacterium]
MRPAILNPLFAPISTLPGVGPALARQLEKLLDGKAVARLLWHLPTGLIDRRYRPTIAQAEAGRIAIFEVSVLSHAPASGRGRPTRVHCADATGHLDLVFFHAKADYLEKTLPVGSNRLVSGKVEFFNGMAQIIHPDYILPPERGDDLPAIEPVHPLSGNLSGKQVRKFIAAAIGRTPPFPEWLDPAFLTQRGWPTFNDAIRIVQAPQNEGDISPLSSARLRLAYDELLATQLALGLIRHKQRAACGRALFGTKELQQKVIQKLNFTLTSSQTTSISEILADMEKPERMLRLLQGDVGSGKTLVALMAMLTAVEAGCQAALMAPTEILARQHLKTIAPLAEAAGVPIAVLTGRDKGKIREATLSAIASGEAKIIIGTHALFQEEVAFADLGLAVIDEQHRFGVHQRLQLTSKGHAVHLLVMTATPIPRTLTMTAYGDMDSSRLLEKPAGRKPIDTRRIPLEKLEDVTEGIYRKIAEGARVFWICPLVEESEKIDLAAARERHAWLAGHFGNKAGLVHGRMKPAEKDAAMAAFASGETPILVATSVIEVGVDVPEATIMVIEHAERFGLAQLHQMRGRIGRGDKPSTCILLFGHPLSEIAQKRLAILHETEDGFRIAEEDLRLRGAGEILGTKQSGMPEFRIADLAVHADIISIARDDAKIIIARDAELSTPRGQALRILLYLFERDASMGYLASG